MTNNESPMTNDATIGLSRRGFLSGAALAVQPNARARPKLARFAWAFSLNLPYCIDFSSKNLPPTSRNDPQERRRKAIPFARAPTAVTP